MDASSYDRAARYLDVMRDMIEHENTLLNQRLTWMFTLQGLLFGAVSFLWKTSALPVTAIGLVGLISCLSIGYSLARGLGAVNDLLAIARAYKEALPTDVVFPPTIGARHKAIEWLLPPRLLPWVLAIAWLAILAFRISNPMW